ncbi:hypothetical protein [Bifidobacterium sp. SO1]|uniref:hypothetical protein n=1 Tax=Bifidobacterium sp. SO1 TaxID=2809029 RepID=UPI001BDDB516|nr:hypothetical protein [Bifidobacterium sp. SO1]MBT1161202.1 hypothetical protein [Bifidobacterium sp. SO1]
MGKNLGVRFRVYEPNGPALGFLPQPIQFDATLLHDGNGSLSLTYSRKAINGYLLDRALGAGLELALEVCDDTEPTSWHEMVNGRYIRIQADTDALDLSDTVKLTCPSYGWLLNKALMLNLNVLEQKGDNKGKRVFRNATVGLILRTMMDENFKRGGVPVNCVFDTAKDSAGQPWKDRLTLAFEPGVSMYTVLQNMSDNFLCDWCFYQRELRVYNHGSAALSRDMSSIRVPMRDVVDAPAQESIESVASHILVRGDNQKAFTQDNPTAPTPWGKWELYLSQQGVSDAASAAAYLQGTLDSASRVRGEYTRSILSGNVDYLPLIDWRQGDWITAPTYGVGEKVQVKQVTISMDANQVSSDSGRYKINAVLNDKVYNRSVTNARKVTGMLGGAVAGGTGNGIPAPEKDHRVAKAPVSVTVTTDAYIAEDGNAVALARVIADPVDQATDDTAIDVKGYRVEYRKNIAGAPWQFGGETDAQAAAVNVMDAAPAADAGGSTLGITNLECGVEYGFRVRAIPTYSDRPGEWSKTVVVRTEADVTPPSVPSKPILSSSLGTVDVRWDGKNNVNGGMEADFDHCEVGMSNGPTNWTYRDMIMGDGHCIVTGLEVGKTYWFALRSVDRSDNKSDWGAGASITVVPAVTQEELDASADRILAEAKKDAAAQVAVVDKKVTANSTAIAANKTEAEKADQTIRDSLTATNQKVQANSDANTAQQKQIDAANNALAAAQKTISQHGQAISNAQKQADAAKNAAETNAQQITDLKAVDAAQQKTIDQTAATLTEAGRQITANKDSITAINKHAAEVDATVSQARKDIAAATSTADKALDKANKVGLAVDGLHQVYTGPDDPSTLEGVTLKDGDLWNRTQKYWTRWQGKENNSVSLLADFYTGWEGEADNSPSWLTPLSTRVIGTYRWNGSQWLELTNADMDSVKQSLEDNERKQAELDQTITETNKTLDKAKTDLAQAQKDLSQAKTDIAANKTGLTEANKTIVQAQKDIAANKTALDKANSDLATASKQVAANSAAIEKNRTDITAASSTAQKALDKANSVGTSLDGMHNVYTGPDDPTTLKDVTVRQGDLWYRTQAYWTRWAGEKNNSVSILADFYTGWEGAANNSPSWLSTLSSRIVDANVYDGERWNQINLVAANILATGSVVADNMAANSITTDKLAAGSIVSDKIAAAAITAGKLAANSVLASNITANAVTTEKISALAVTAAKLAVGSVIAEKISANAVTTEKLAALAVTAAKIAVGAITADKLAANSVTTNALAANAVTAVKIAAKSINAGHMTANSIVSEALAANSVTADKIKAGAVNAEKIAAESIDATKIKGNLLSGTTVQGGKFVTTNNRLLINDDGLTLKDASGGVTMAMKSSDGSVTVKGPIVSGGSITGTTITGALVQTTATANRGVKLTDKGLAGYDANGDPTFAVDAATGRVSVTGAINAGSTITGTAITGSSFQTAGKHVDISDDGLVFTDGEGKPVLTWAPIGLWTRWAGEENNSVSLLADFYTEWEGEANNSPSRLTTLADKWRLTMDAPIMSSAVISGSTIKGGVVEGAEIRGLKTDGTRYLTINQAGMTLGDKLSYDSTTGSLTVKGTISGSTIKGSVFQSTNGRLLINDSGLTLKNTSGAATLTMNSADGSVTLKGPVMSGGSLSGVTVTGSTIQTTATANRGVKLTSGGLVGYDASGTVKFTLDVNGNLKANGGVLANGTITAPNVTGGTITGAAVKTTNGRLTLTDSGMVLKNASGTNTFVLQASDGSVSMKGSLTSGSTITGSTITGSTITGGKIQTTNQRIVINDSGIAAKDASGNTTFWINASSGAVAIKGSLVSGSTITGATIKGGSFTTTNGRFTITDDHMQVKDAAGNSTLWINTSTGAISIKGSLVSGSTISGAAISGGTVTGAKFVSAKQDSSFLSEDGKTWMKFGNYTSVLSATQKGFGLQLRTANTALQIGSDYCQLMVGTSSTDTSRVDMNGTYAALIRNGHSFQATNAAMYMTYDSNTYVKLTDTQLDFYVQGTNMQFKSDGLHVATLNGKKFTPRSGTAAGNSEKGYFSFNHNCGYVPTVVVSMANENGIHFHPVVTNITDTGCTIRLARNDTDGWETGKQAVTVRWIAF